ncbi:hypothetical protein FBU30_011052 [Linnemannia zychae]|nr:hypothetical protein FBU30_011052 [Linnemannia zychae]
MHLKSTLQSLVLLVLACFQISAQSTSTARIAAPPRTTTTTSTRAPLPTSPSSGADDPACAACVNNGLSKIEACAAVASTMKLSDDYNSMSTEHKTCYCAVSSASDYMWLEGCSNGSKPSCPKSAISEWTNELTKAKAGDCTGAPSTGDKGNSCGKLMLDLNNLMSIAVGAATLGLLL